MPVIRGRWSRIRLRAGRSSWQELMTPRHWNLDQASPFEATRVLDPKPYKPFLEESLRNAAGAFPVFRNVKIVETWAGMIDVTPDLIPIISPVESTPGFFIATGFSGHGFGIGPGAGKLVAELVAGEKPSVDPAAFRFSRYFERGRPQPSPGAL
jgi:glycine/D-amino acid oxidase-like deaminating enzyme